jgi:hypothetical protein
MFNVKTDAAKAYLPLITGTMRWARAYGVVA